ncbi:hypothetical protein [Geomicrobium sp. JCM 19055]|uniref:hypothetical protein n=1 Tax=Geomicrobium sp. JCM 19055 TaxID=1460649 RepID=UPI00045EDC6A|nr:hypothetical protein [Geomicrobium sp. JCM 19055]GAJ99101.1 hypothetical protein JCM19055_2083 [Geomicrobium sp. JCM 19055]
MDFIWIVLIMFIVSSLINMFTQKQQKQQQERQKPGTGGQPQDVNRQPSQGNQREQQPTQEQDNPFGDLGKQLEEMFGGGQQQRTDHPTERQPEANTEMYSEARQNDEVVVSDEMKEYERKREEARKRRLEAEQQLKDKVVNLESKRRVADASQAVSFKNITSKDVVQGMIWSEILTEPRGTKPHRIRRTRSR